MFERCLCCNPGQEKNYRLSRTLITLFGFQNRGGLREIVEEGERDSDTRIVGRRYRDSFLVRTMRNLFGNNGASKGASASLLNTRSAGHEATEDARTVAPRCGALRS